MKFSIVICYRNREEHLNITIPRLKEKFKDMDHEIIVVEQDDTKKFRRGNLNNVGAKYAAGDVLIFHNVDHYPTDDVRYWKDGVDVYLAVKRVVFVYNDLTLKPIEEVPGGYRHFRESVDDDFLGGALAIKSKAFFHMNGFNPRFVGWGFEDADMRSRILHHGFTMERDATGTFYELDHVDSGPPFTDQDFVANINRAPQWQKYLNQGVKNQHQRVNFAPAKHPQVDKWLLASDFDGPTHIVKSSFNWDEGKE